jgi:hypothetical protein
VTPARARAPAQPCPIGGRSRFLRLRLRIPDHLPSAYGERKGRWSGTTGALSEQAGAGTRARSQTKTEGERAETKRPGDPDLGTGARASLPA